jgi:hypothetical protein
LFFFTLAGLIFGAGGLDCTEVYVGTVGDAGGLHVVEVGARGADLPWL